jgi:hypothetical protein
LQFVTVTSLSDRFRAERFGMGARLYARSLAEVLSINEIGVQFALTGFVRSWQFIAGRIGSGDYFRIADHPRTTPFVDRRAFVGTNPTGELITSGLPVIRPESSESVIFRAIAAKNFTSRR